MKNELSINAGYARIRCGTNEKRSISEAARLCRDAGFRWLDVSPETSSPAWEDDCRALAEEFASIGVKTEQTHVPFFRYQKEHAEAFTESIRRCLKCSAILGAKYAVIHADEYWRPGMEYNSAAAVAYTKEFYGPLVDYAANLGVTAAFENVFEDGMCPAGQRSRCCSTMEELLATVDLFRDYNAGICWDFGHGHVAFGNKVNDALRQAAPYIVCTHVHDNYYGTDLHLPPYLGKLDWNAQMCILNDAKYAGKLSLELVYGAEPDDMLPDYLAFAYRSGLRLLREA